MLSSFLAGPRVAARPFLLGCIIAVAAVGAVQPAEVAANPYVQSYVDGAGLWRSNCTWWAWQRWYEVHGEHLPQWGNAGEWAGAAAAAGYRVDGVPAVGSIVMTWESWAGHVAFVEEVDPADPQTFLISEYGYSAGTTYNERWITTDGSLQFIHPDISQLVERLVASGKMPDGRWPSAITLPVDLDLPESRAAAHKGANYLRGEQ